MSDLHELLREIIRFRDARDWGQFHTPKNLASALGIEIAELQEPMLWKTDSEVDQLLADPERSRELRYELADVLIYALLFADAAGIEVADAIREKLAANEAKYPVAKAKGKSLKYTELRIDPQSGS